MDNLELLGIPLPSPHVCAYYQIGSGVSFLIFIFLNFSPFFFSFLSFPSFFGVEGGWLGFWGSEKGPFSNCHFTVGLGCQTLPSPPPPPLLSPAEKKTFLTNHKFSTTKFYSRSLKFTCIQIKNSFYLQHHDI